SFWSVVGMMVVGLVVSTVVLMVRHRRTPARWLPALTVVGVVAAFTGGLSLCYSTFGWVACGPRLAIPLLPAFMVAALHTAGAPMTTGLRWLFATALRSLLVGGVVALLGAAQVGVVWHPQAIELPLVVAARCPQLVPIQAA